VYTSGITVQQGVHGMSEVARMWTLEELRRLVELADKTYEKANELAEKYGKKIYEGLMSVLSFRGASEAAAKFITIEWRNGLPIAVLTDDNLWVINRELLTALIKTIDVGADVTPLFRETKPDPNRFAGNVRLSLPGGWGEIASFYIMNAPLPKMRVIIYILHLSIYVRTFLTATISEVYTASEDFLNLIDSIDTKKGAVEFLTRLFRRRYIPEDQYALGLDVIEKRRELHTENFRELLEEEEARQYMAHLISSGVHGIVLRLQDIIRKYNNKPIPRSELLILVGELYAIITNLENMLSTYKTILDKLNNVLMTTGEKTSSEKLRKVIEEIITMH